jgi:N,N-dimethylformamidase beta subunit-like, C-terminal
MKGRLTLVALLIVLATAGAVGLVARAASTAFPGKNGRIVFNDQNGYLVLVNPDGTGLVRLAATRTADQYVGASSLAAQRATLVLGNGSRPFAGDRPDLTTISPNGDGYRDAATLAVAGAYSGIARLEVDRADNKGTVYGDSAELAAGGKLAWSPPPDTQPGTYIVHVTPTGGTTQTGVVRVQEIDAAAGAAGYAPGQLAQIAVATDAHELHVDVLHMDATSAVVRGNDAVSGTVVERLPAIAWQHADAPHNLAVPIGRWPSGVYFVRIRSTDGREGFAPFVLRPSRLGAHRVAVVMPTNTWQAYNFYDRDGDGRGDTWYAGWHLHTARLGRPFLNHGIPNHFRRYDLQFLIWAARVGMHADYLTDADLDRIDSGAHLARLYDFMVFPGHHEYVTGREYDAIRGYRDRGGNLAWLSANNFFWKVVRHGPTLERVAKWRDLGRPEAALIGVQYRGNDEGQRRGPMQPVPGAAPWLFAGTPLEQGRPWGNFGIEIDHTAAASPPGTTVLASIPDLYGPGFTAQMTYYETPNGAKVFAAGAFTLAEMATGRIGARLLENLFAHMEQP